ncbi:MAG TPA: HDIG domain-containing protein [Caldilineae bacterium]|nr:HDIG domain-containing protein [Caldilineae bacterium]
MTEERQSILTSTPTTPEGESGFLSQWSRDPSRWRARFNLAAFCVFVALAIMASLLVDWPISSNLQISVGQISKTNVPAPRPITFTSEVLTKQAQDRAAASLAPVYDPPQTRIARQQLARAEEIVAFIEVVRNDPNATEEQKINWLTSMADVPISEQVAAQMLALDDASWQDVTEETVRVLDRAMQQEIREDTLQSAKRAVPSLVTFRLNEDEASVVTAVVQGLLRPNTFLNDERTEAARQEAIANVEPVERSIAQGEIILRQGDRADALDIEALDALGLLQTERTWQDYLSAFLMAGLLTGMLVAFVMQRQRHFWSNNLQVFLLSSIFIAFVLLAKVMSPEATLLPYLFPLAAMTMLVSALIDLPIAVVATLLIGALVGVFTDGNIEIVVYVVFGALAGALALGRAEGLNSFVRAGIWIILINLVVLSAFRIPLFTPSNSGDLLAVATATLVNGVFASSFTLVIFYLLGQVFGLTTNLQLLELSRPTHPLLRQLLLKAPGTYHHSLIVSNMAEEAASAIGANVLLTRVGSYYHDIGKTVRPYFFIENNTDGVNPHDRLDPYTSARIIISHVTDGIELAHKFKIPNAIVDFIREHHGTTRVEYFYYQACQEHDSPDEVDESEFRYPGPKPRSRETAILMLADGCEATIRAMNPGSREEMLELIRSVINRRLMSGQLDQSQLTLRDLSRITDAFARVLQGIHHPRIKYPNGVGASTTKQASAPTAQPATVR